MTDLPAVLTRATRISWTMDSNHGLAESPFSGIVQAQRGTIERWKFTMDIRRLGRREAAEAMAFFLQLEGRLGTFRMGDPAAAVPIGRASGAPILSASGAAGDRTIATSGWTPNTTAILYAGDWIQIGDQLARVSRTVDSSSTGTATLYLWPRLMIPFATLTPIIVRNPRGIFRFTSDLPAWETAAANHLRPYKFSLTGTQEILTPSA